MFHVKHRKEVKMTVKELVRFCGSCEHVKRGYCCYQEDNKAPYTDLKLIGTNLGVYGWNWTLYYDPKTDTAYISDYRNVPKYIDEK